MKIIDLRSDTVTLPTKEMRQAMYEAELGDDFYGEDPTVNRLEEIAAQRLGKEAALLTASGTMGNLIAILTHTNRGDEILLGNESHTFWYEGGGAAALGGVVMHTIPDGPDGQMDLSTMEQAIRPKGIVYPSTTLLCLENTHNRCGGAVLSPEYTSAITKLAHQHGLRVHLDGARIFSAAVALKVAVNQLAAPVDSVSFCLSKDLSAPVGSLLCGSRDFIEEARKYRQMVGGGMRQAGIIAAAGIVALERMVDRLTEDHANALHFARGLAGISGFTVHPEKVKTNMVVFESPDSISASEFIQRMNALGLKFNTRGGRRWRAVTHRMISTADIDEALNRFKLLEKELSNRH